MKTMNSHKRTCDRYEDECDNEESDEDEENDRRLHRGAVYWRRRSL